MSIGNWTMLDPAMTGEIIFSSQWNNEFQNVINNCNPDGVGSASETVVAMQTMRDPYPNTTVSLATSLRQELQSLRFQLNEIIGKTNWYLRPEISLEEVVEGMVTGGDLHDHTGTGESGGGAPIGTVAIEDDAITTEKIIDGAVTKEKLAPDIFLGKIIKFKSTHSILTNSITTDLALTTSPPLSTAGTKIFENTITPEAIDNLIVIEYMVQATLDAHTGATLTIVEESLTNALFASFSTLGFWNNEGLGSMRGLFIYKATSLNELTFSIRGGVIHFGDVLRINKYFGAAGISYMTLKEIEHA